MNSGNQENQKCKEVKIQRLVILLSPQCMLQITRHSAVRPQFCDRASPYKSTYLYAYTRVAWMYVGCYITIILFTVSVLTWPMNAITIRCTVPFCGSTGALLPGSLAADTISNVAFYYHILTELSTCRELSLQSRLFISLCRVFFSICYDSSMHLSSIPSSRIGLSLFVFNIIIIYLQFHISVIVD